MTAPDAGSEKQTERDGFLSYAAEWHAFTHGVYDGAAEEGLRPSEELPDVEDIQEEPHYYKGGYIAGSVATIRRKVDCECKKCSG